MNLQLPTLVRPQTSCPSPRVEVATCRGRRRCGPGLRYQSAFSLLELMIAIVILGLGLIMVATMYPVAWMRARDLSEFTSHQSATEAAHALVQTLARANDGAGSPPPLAGSFAGDLVYDQSATWGGAKIVATPNTRVHAFYLENLTVAPRRFVPDRLEPWRTPQQRSPEYPPWYLASDQQNQTGGETMLNPSYLLALDTICDQKNDCDNLFLSAQIQFGSRLYPPLGPRDDVEANGKFSGDDLKWDEALDSTRFAWAAFHRLLEPDFSALVGNFALSDEDTIEDERLYEQDRVFQMYYVTLRRPQATLRYARQDPDPDKIPNPGQREIPVTPAALDPELDVILPEPWRVQVYFPKAQIKPQADSTGIPTEIEVNTANAPTAGFVVDMFQVGTQFIDEQNGAIYRVIKRRIQTQKTGGSTEEAYLTLDREVVIEDLDDGAYPDGPDGKLDMWVDYSETLRTVWVFPPPVESERTRHGAPIFMGKQPVVDVEDSFKLKLTVR